MSKTICIAFALILAVAVNCPAQAVHVGGDVSQPGDWTVARLHHDLAADVQVVSYTSHGQPHSATCVPLLSLLKASGAPTELKMDPKADPKTKNRLLRLVVVVQGGDGYTVTLSMAELLPDIGDRPVWIALDADGKPLSPRDAPVRLIVPDDKKPGRWVRAVQSISVSDPTEAAH